MPALLPGCFRCGFTPGIERDALVIGSDAGGNGVCGNAILEAGEDCDPPSAAGCSADCRWGGTCGNGIVEIGEQCEPPGPNCGPDCQIPSSDANPGAPCTTAADCGTGGRANLTAFCFSEETFGFPGGFCALQGCVPGMSDCPIGSHCEQPDGFQRYCIPDCTPGPGGPVDCRSDATSDFAYQCLPDIIDPSSAGCWLGCASDRGCNPCSGGLCERDVSASCMTDDDCLASPTAWACNTTVNACHPDHAPGPSPIGGACTSDLDCGRYAQCARTGSNWPGGYCTTRYCATWAALPEFDCPMGSICPALTAFYGGIFQICTASCTIDPGDPTGSAQCDAVRGEDADYICIEASTPMASFAELCDDAGAPGFCLSWGLLFGGDTSCP